MNISQRNGYWLPDHLKACKAQGGGSCNCGLSQPKFLVLGYQNICLRHSKTEYKTYYLKSEVDAYLASKPALLWSNEDTLENLRRKIPKWRRARRRADCLFPAFRVNNEYCGIPACLGCYHQKCPNKIRCNICTLDNCEASSWISSK